MFHVKKRKFNGKWENLKERKTWSNIKKSRKIIKNNCGFPLGDK